MKKIESIFAWCTFSLLICICKTSPAQVVREWINTGICGEAIALDEAENVYVSAFTGFFSDALHYCYATSKFKPDGTHLWGKNYDITDIVGYLSHEAHQAVDKAGNVYLADVVSRGDDKGDYIIFKYATDGSLCWTNYYNGSGFNEDIALAITADIAGNVYVTGISQTQGYQYDCVTIKYSPQGAQLWLARYNSGAWDEGMAIVVDDQGYVYVGGCTCGFAAQDDYLIIKYSPDGAELWVRHYNGDTIGSWLDDWLSAIVVDDAGNVYVTGYSEAPNSAHGLATLKYSPTGDQLWVNRYDYGDKATNEPDFVQKAGLAVDKLGNVYVAGRNWSNSTRYDYVTIKYSSDGAEQWVHRYNGSGNEDDFAVALALDDIGCAYVTGVSHGGGGLYGTYNDIVTIKYASDGTQLWLDRFDRGSTFSDEEGKSIIVDSKRNVYVTGTLTLKYEQPAVVVNDNDTEKLLKFDLSQNYPNPFNPETIIEYQLPCASTVEISVFNLQGQKVATLVREPRTAGGHKITWNGTDEAGRPVVSGVYLYQLKAGKFITATKMLLLR